MSKTHASMGKTHYGRLLLMAVLSFISMYVLMYAMVDAFANVYANFNQFYMAWLMTAPMVIIEIALMGAMYQNKRSMNPHHGTRSSCAGWRRYRILRSGNCAAR
jgi:hypothetical protein